MNWPDGYPDETPTLLGQHRKPKLTFDRNTKNAAKPPSG